LLNLLTGSPLWAQQDTVPHTQRIRIDHADALERIQIGDSIVQKLIGGVELSQDSIFLYCDSAIIENSIRVFALGDEVTIQQGDSIAAFADTLFYDARTRQADLIEDVVLINGQRKLFTQRLHYNLTTKVATYETGATITDSLTQITSRRGYYYVDEETIYFKDSVVVIHPEFTLRADTLKFRADTQLVYFLGPTLMVSDSNRIYCEDGFYDVDEQLAEFRVNAQYAQGEQRATADIIRYDGAREAYALLGNARFWEGDQQEARADSIFYNAGKETYRLKGKASFRDSVRTIVADEIQYDARKGQYTTRGRAEIVDGPQILLADQVDYSEESGLGLARGNVIWRDTSADLTIRCAEADYNQDTGYLKASGGARGRPLLVTIIDGDSLYMAADTLLSLKPDSLASDSSRLLLAFHDVRLYKTDMQALCDSVAYNTADSLFRLFRSPIIWSDTTQFTADTIHLSLANQELDRIFLYNNSFIITESDDPFFNQVKGRYITAHFRDSELRRADVEGNAETVYYALDDEGAYVGVNKTVCSEMQIYFRDNEVDRISFLNQPQGKLDPMGGVDHEQLRLENFHWETACRPESLDDLFTMPRCRIVPAAAAPGGGSSGPPPRNQRDAPPDPSVPPAEGQRPEPGGRPAPGQRGGGW
jgi:lipopolysaccharide export system protein LptA